MTEVTPRLSRGPRPEGLAALRELGFTQVIDLQSGVEDALTETRYEFDCLHPERYGVRLVRIPCSDLLPPRQDQVIEFLQALRSGRKTYLHCHSGVDRTGFMVAVYRMQIQGWSYRRAHEEWVSMGRHWWYSWWSLALKSYEGGSGD